MTERKESEMLKEKKQKRIKELERLVSFHNEKYFIENAPVISDYEFDQMVEELKKLNPDSDLLKNIGSDLTVGRKKVKHEEPMLSLDKCYDDKALGAWASKFKGDLIASPKIDGLAVSLRYGKDGTLNLASTRGDGFVGDEITQNALSVKNIPRRIKVKNVEIRGEVYMPLSVFAKYQNDFANPRNLAAGGLKQKDPKKTAEYDLSFFAYDIMGANIDTEVKKNNALKKLGFDVIEFIKISHEDLKAPFEHFFKKRSEYDFETDGVVYKADVVIEQQRLGNTAHHPRFSIAYKFQGDSGVTRLLDVEWSVSRSGLITPIGIVEPIELSGAIVRRASLHNVGWMINMNLKKSSKVMMMRRGGVIPHLEAVVEAGKGEIDIPKRCPSCKGEVERVDDFLYCKNPKGCVQSKVGELIHFIQTIECDGFGEKLVERLYSSGLVTEPDEFYALTEDDLLRLERMGDVLAHKLISNISSKRELRLDVFLRSLGIRELGKNLSTILTRFGTLKKIRSLQTDELSSIHGVGDVIANEVISGLKNKGALVDRLLKHVRLIEGEKSLHHGGKFDGMVFLFTGGLSSMTRNDAARRVEEEEGRVASSVTNEVDYLVVGAEGGAGSKLEKAKKLAAKRGKIKIITERDFLKMLG